MTTTQAETALRAELVAAFVHVGLPARVTLSLDELAQVVAHTATTCAAVVAAARAARN